MADQHMGWAKADPDYLPPEVDISKPSIARVYDAVLGGKDNFQVDRAVVEEVQKTFPDGGGAARVNRALLGRAVRYMADAGIDQFLDLGSGLPTVQNTHQIAQAVNPAARVVYVDNDPMVLAHGHALLAENKSTVVVTADLMEPEQVLGSAEVAGFIDLSRPLGLIMNAIVHHILDEEDPYGIVARYKGTMPSCSYLLLTHFSNSSPEARGLEQVLLRTLGRGQLRSREQITRFFDGLDLVEPGVVHLPDWHPDEPVSRPLDISGLLYLGALARKP
jgi:hypothetical protein